MARPPLQQRFAEAMGQLLGPDFPPTLGLAVSGGGDSMAMLHLAAGWARVWGVALRVATVDHGLRPQSAAEAALVADEASALGLPHATLHWHGWRGEGNLQDAARRARLELIDTWRGDCGHVLFAHTRDDQAETLLLRLRRGSGVEGLGAMHAVRRVDGARGPWRVVRPLLSEARSDLRHYLGVLSIPFVDDPSNDDEAFERVRMRALLERLDEEGLGAPTLAATAGRMRAAAQALRARALDVARRVDARPDHPAAEGSVILDRDAFAPIEADTRHRIAAEALMYVSSAPYRPRLSALEAAVETCLSGGKVTLHGCLMLARGACIHVCREPAAVCGLVARPGELWDRRWRLQAPGGAGLTVRALGTNGLGAVPKRWPEQLPAEMIETLPALFDEDGLVACPALDHGEGVIAAFLPPGGPFPDRLALH